jgi:tetratricopeptide (TPR) repeat protein
LIECGQRRDGENLIEQAHWVPLGDAANRLNFLRSLGERGHKDASRREMELLWCISEPNSHFAAAAARFLALDAAKRKDYLSAALGIEQSMLRCLRLYTQFVANGGYALIPSQVHQLRALGLLEAGKLDACKKEIELSLLASPDNLDLPIALVPELEKRGQKKDADKLYERCHAAYARLCHQYPRCAWAHNSLAWLAACCRRDLDEALQHARTALELSPTTAGYHDTLAEVHFQRGEKDQAIRSQKRAIELDPQRKYYRRQMERLQKGNPAAELPAEED